MLKDDFDLSSIDFAGARQKAGGKDLQILLMGSAGTLCGCTVAAAKFYHPVGSVQLKRLYVFLNYLYSTYLFSQIGRPKDQDSFFGGFAS